MLINIITYLIINYLIIFKCNYQKINIHNMLLIIYKYECNINIVKK